LDTEPEKMDTKKEAIKEEEKEVAIKEEEEDDLKP